MCACMAVKGLHKLPNSTSLIPLLSFSVQNKYCSVVHWTNQHCWYWNEGPTTEKKRRRRRKMSTTYEAKDNIQQQIIRASFQSSIYETRSLLRKQSHCMHCIMLCGCLSGMKLHRNKWTLTSKLTLAYTTASTAKYKTGPPKNVHVVFCPNKIVVCFF